MYWALVRLWLHSTVLKPRKWVLPHWDTVLLGLLAARPGGVIDFLITHFQLFSATHSWLQRRVASATAGMRDGAKQGVVCDCNRHAIVYMHNNRDILTKHPHHALSNGSPLRWYNVRESGPFLASRSRCTTVTSHDDAYCTRSPVGVACLNNKSSV